METPKFQSLFSIISKLFANHLFFSMNDIEIVNVSGKSPEQVRQLQLKKIIVAVEKNEFIYNQKVGNYYKKGKRTLFWFQTTARLNKMFPNNKLNRMI